MKAYPLKTPWTIYVILINVQMMSFTSRAITITVDGLCTLSDAIMAANDDVVVGSCAAGNEDDVIVIAEADRTIAVNNGTFLSGLQSNVNVAFPTISSNLTIEGNGLHIQADSSVNKFRVLDFIGALGERLILRDITISGADDGVGFGSALFTLGGRLTLENSTFFDNRGALLFAETADIEIDNIVVNNNWVHHDDDFSPGIDLVGSIAVIKNSSIINNHVNFTGNDFILSEEHVAGGIGITNPETAITQIINTTISGNRSIAGGGISIRDTNSRSTESGTFIFVKFIHTTISNNQALFGGGVVVHNVNSSYSFNHSIIAGNMAEQELGREILVVQGANLTLDGSNLIQQHTMTPELSNLLGASDIISNQGIEQLLNSLENVNGHWVHPLKSGSDAIDSGDDNCLITTDQLNLVRPIDGDQDGVASCDIGSVEFDDLLFKSGFELET